MLSLRFSRIAGMIFRSNKEYANQLRITGLSHVKEGWGLSDTPHAKLFELSLTKMAKPNQEASPECLRCLWPFFKLSRIVGMCPISRRGNVLEASYRIYTLCWLPTVVALVAQLSMTSISIRGFVNVIGSGISTDEIVDHCNGVIYFVHDLGNCIFIIWKIRGLPKFLEACTRIEIMCKKYKDSNDGLVLQCTLLFYCLTFAQAFGNVLYYWSEANRKNATTLDEFFRAYNTDLLGNWGSYNTGIFVCISVLICDMSWTFGDTLLALISVLLARYFVRMNGELQRKRTSISPEIIEQLRCDYRELCNLVKYANDIFAPLFLLTYLGNGGYLLTRLFTGMFGDLTKSDFGIVFESVYAAFYQVFIKILLPSCLAANLNSRAQEGMHLVQRWPTELAAKDNKYSLLLIGRFVSHFRSTAVGLSGSGYFTISKSFIVTLVSALITYEVIILQFEYSSK